MKNRAGFVRDLRIVVNDLRSTPTFQYFAADEVSNLFDEYDVPSGHIGRIDAENAFDRTQWTREDADEVADVLEQVLFLVSDDES